VAVIQANRTEVVNMNLKLRLRNIVRTGFSYCKSGKTLNQETLN
jgi:hypothetical protein